MHSIRRSAVLPEAPRIAFDPLHFTLAVKYTHLLTKIHDVAR